MPHSEHCYRAHRPSCPRPLGQLKISCFPRFPYAYHTLYDNKLDFVGRLPRVTKSRGRSHNPIDVTVLEILN